MYIYYQSYEVREQISKRSSRARPKRIIQRISRRRRERKRRQGNLAGVLDNVLGMPEPTGWLSFNI